MAAAGYEYPPVEVSWNKRDLLLFAASIGCTVDELHFLYELHPNFQAFPTYPILLPFKQTSTDVIDFYARQSRSTASNVPDLPRLDPRRMVDGQRKMTFHKPLPVTSAARTFDFHTKILGCYDKGKATVLETQQTILDRATHEVYATVVGSAFFVGQGGWGGPPGAKTVDFPPPRGRAADAVHTLRTTPEVAHLYRLNGDYNPLHATPEPGQKMGFGGAIVHGLYCWNASAHAVLQAFGGSEGRNLRSFEARFASPVKPGDTLVTEMWRVGNVEKGFGEVRFVTRVEGGKVVLTNGRAFVRIVGVKSKL